VVASLTGAALYFAASDLISIVFDALRDGTVFVVALVNEDPFG
jgi:hypothetical protein